MTKTTAAMTRREALKKMGIAAAGAVLPARLLYAADALRFRSSPFTLGVASGYPTHDSVVLWTRLAPSPLEPGGGVPEASAIPVRWLVASDERLRNVVASGVEYATPQWAHSIHAEPTGLQPGRDYWYRFSAGGRHSEVGRTRTAPRPDDATARLRVAAASCQQYEHGYFSAYRWMLEDDLDLVLHVGDYIYETSWGADRIRSHGAPETITLEDYRIRHALYRGERELQAAHARYPWLVTWDDHEVENDYAGAVSEEDDERDWFLARRAAAYQAYYEHMPLPRRAAPYGAHLRLFAERRFGDLANVLMLDTRQHRSPLACTTPGVRNSRAANCSELHDPARTKLGAAQEGWLASRLRRAGARWNILASGTVMAYLDEQPGDGEAFWNDGWNGYPAARARLMETLQKSAAGSPIVVSGDVHSFLTAEHHLVPHDRDSPKLAVEFVATSITSNASPQSAWDRLRANNPNVLFANSERRGYLRLDFDRERLRADLIALHDVRDRASERFVLQSFVVEANDAASLSATS